MPMHKKSHEHSARLKNPGKFVSFTTGEDKGGKGVNFIYGIRTDAGPEGGKTEIQAIRFDSNLWSVEAAKKWLSDHDKKHIKFTAATIKEDEAPAAPAASSGPAITTSNMGATYAPKVLPMTSHYGDYSVDKFDQSFMKKMKKSLGESVMLEAKTKRVTLVEIPGAMLERKKKYRIDFDGKPWGEVYFNMTGYVAAKGIPIPDSESGKLVSLDLPEGGISAIKHEIAWANKQWQALETSTVSEEDEPPVNAPKPAIEPDGTPSDSTPAVVDAKGKDLIVPRDTDPALFDDYVKIYNSLKPEERATDEKLAELAASIIKKYFGDKKTQWGSDGVEVMEDQLIFKNFSSSEDTAPEGDEGLNEGIFHKAMTMLNTAQPIPEAAKYKEPKYFKDPPFEGGAFKENDVVEDESGKKFRIYNINLNWAALIPVDTGDKEYSASDKRMIPIGDLHEFYKKVSK